MPKYFYDLMLDCWQPEEFDRPTFNRTAKILSGISKMNGVKEGKGTLVCPGQQLMPYEFVGPKYKVLKLSEVSP